MKTINLFANTSAGDAPYGAFIEERWRFIASIALPASLAFIVLALIGRIIFFLQADAIAVGENGLLGGDFLAFWTASSAFRADDAVAMYTPENFEAALSVTSGVERHFMLWQYPPTIFLLIFPVAFLPYLTAYWTWLAASGTLCLIAIRNLGLSWPMTAIVFSAPYSLRVLNTGQIGFMTTAFMLTAAFMPKSRPILAGVAAGLLTVKPQLGLLIPLAYAAAGCWRAFGAAAVTATVMALATLPILGADAWVAFYESVFRLYSDYTGSGHSTPATNMTTPLAQLLAFGVDRSLAATLHYVCAGIIAAATLLIWRNVSDWRLKGGFLCAASIIVTPYAYGYEMMALAGAAFAMSTPTARGWLYGERPTLLALWIVLATFTEWDHLSALQIPFVVSLAALLLVGRRALVSIIDSGSVDLERFRAFKRRLLASNITAEAGHS